MRQRIYKDPSKVKSKATKERNFERNYKMIS